jgi:hypothetical protein
MRSFPAAALVLATAALVGSAPGARATPGLDEAGPRDPFATLLDVRPPEDPNLTPLEKIPLEQLHLTGVILGASPKALFEGPDGHGYVARVGDGVGTHRARIQRISANAIALVETWRDGIGGVSLVHINLDTPAAQRAAGKVTRR